MISFIIRLAREAKQICLQGQTVSTQGSLTFTSPKDLVTKRRVESFLGKKISAAWPDQTILGEKTGTIKGSGPFNPGLQKQVIEIFNPDPIFPDPQS